MISFLDKVVSGLSLVTSILVYFNQLAIFFDLMVKKYRRQSRLDA